MQEPSAIHRILFAVDLDEVSNQAAPTVIRLARLTGAEVQVTHVWTAQLDREDLSWDMEAPAQVRDGVATVVQELSAAGVKANAAVRACPDGRTAEQIVAAAKDYGADLIVVGSHGRSNLQALFLGSVSREVVTHFAGPVLVVRGGAARRRGPVRRILLAISEGDEIPGAVAAAITIAKPAKAKVTVLHARYILPSGLRGAFVEAEEDSAGLVDRIVAELKARGIDAGGESVLARHGASGEIIEAAKAWNADLIIVGSRRLSDFAALVLRSTATAVVRGADRPVLIARRSTGRRSRKSTTHRD